MKTLKLIGATALLLLSSQVSAITVGGVTWDPDSPLDFSSFSIAAHQNIDPTTGALSGWGIFTTMNGTDQATFCPGCELTFQFSGYTPIPGSPITVPTFGSTITYSGGIVQVFVDNTPEITNPADPTTLTAANTSDGTLWLDLVGHGNFLGTADANLQTLTGSGFLDVIGGLAQANFNTNTKSNGSDFSQTFSFTQLVNGDPKNANGTGNVASDSIAINAPEPVTLSLLGLGLLGFSTLRRKSV
ncbi:MAG: PEP-CTERM sorting domain-containing protein [Methylobacter sp.]|nr:PEP-CTERM sorting domain-containing protein [Methylobacter sp.]